MESMTYLKVYKRVEMLQQSIAHLHITDEVHHLLTVPFTCIKPRGTLSCEDIHTLLVFFGFDWWKK